MARIACHAHLADAPAKRAEGRLELAERQPEAGITCLLNLLYVMLKLWASNFPTRSLKPTGLKSAFFWSFPLSAGPGFGPNTKNRFCRRAGIRICMLVVTANPINKKIPRPRDFFVGAGERNWTAFSSLARTHNNRYTTPARLSNYKKYYSKNK